MHTVFYELFYPRKTIILFFEDFERNDIIETTPAHCFKNVRWLT